MLPAPTSDEVLEAARRLEGRVVRTPMVHLPALDVIAGGPVAVKIELLQRTGSFKFRGASNFISQITGERRSAGVVAYSSGNHAQGVAAAAADAGIPATIVMPADAPDVKRRRTEDHGAIVVTHDRFGEDRESLAARIAAERGATIVPPYDHPWTIAGQGSVGVEIASQSARSALTPEHVLVPCGGGGLIAGIGLALERLMPGATVHPVEPEGWDDHARSLAAGERIRAAGGPSLCDALLAPEPGEVTFAVNSRLAGPGIVVSDDEVRAAMRFAHEEMRVVVEPGGVVGLAALLAGKAPGEGPWCVVLSGGNVDLDLLTEVLEERATGSN